MPGCIGASRTPSALALPESWDAGDRLPYPHSGLLVDAGVCIEANGRAALDAAIDLDPRRVRLLRCERSQARCPVAMHQG